MALYRKFCWPGCRNRPRSTQAVHSDQVGDSTATNGECSRRQQSRGTVPGGDAKATKHVLSHLSWAAAPLRHPHRREGHPFSFLLVCSLCLVPLHTLRPPLSAAVALALRLPGAQRQAGQQPRNSKAHCVRLQWHNTHCAEEAEKTPTYPPRLLSARQSLLYFTFQYLCLRDAVTFRAPGMALLRPRENDGKLPRPLSVSRGRARKPLGGQPREERLQAYAFGKWTWLTTPGNPAAVNILNIWVRTRVQHLIFWATFKSQD